MERGAMVVQKIHNDDEDQSSVGTLAVHQASRASSVAPASLLQEETTDDGIEFDVSISRSTSAKRSFSGDGPRAASDGRLAVRRKPSIGGRPASAGPMTRSANREAARIVPAIPDHVVINADGLNQPEQLPLASRCAEGCTGCMTWRLQLPARTSTQSWHDASSTWRRQRVGGLSRAQLAHGCLPRGPRQGTSPGGPRDRHGVRERCGGYKPN